MSGNPYIHTQTFEDDEKWPSAITRLTAHFICGLIFYDVPEVIE